MESEEAIAFRHVIKDQSDYFLKIDVEIKEINNKIKPLREKLKELKLEKKNAESHLIGLMDKVGVPTLLNKEHCATLDLKDKKVVQPVTKNLIKEKILSFFSNFIKTLDNFYEKSTEEKTELLYDYIYGKENRDFGTVQRIYVKDHKT